MGKIQFNCRLEEEVAQWIANESERRSVGGRFSQADVIAMLVNTSRQLPAIVTPRKQSKKERVVAELAASDITAQAVGRNDVEYGLHTELPKGPNVAAMTVDKVADDIQSGDPIQIQIVTQTVAERVKFKPPANTRFQGRQRENRMREKGDKTR